MLTARAMDYLPHLELVLAEYAEGEDLEIVMDARSKFADLSGRFSEEDPWHETWSRLFLDWFGFDFPVAGHLSPVHKYVSEHYAELLAEGRFATFRGLMATHRSIFEVSRWSGSVLGLVDMVGGGRYRVHHPYPVGGIETGDVLDARIVPAQGVLTLAAGMIFHPEGAIDLIHKLVDHLREEGRLEFNVVHLLARMNLQHLQGPSLKLKSIYSTKSFLIRSYS